MEEIAVELDCSPNFSSLLVTDPALALQCFFGPCVPAQYRVRGPFPFRDARTLIMNATNNSLAGIRVPGPVDLQRTSPFGITVVFFLTVLTAFLVKVW